MVGAVAVGGYVAYPFLLGPEGKFAKFAYNLPETERAEDFSAEEGLEDQAFSLDMVIKEDFPSVCKMTKSGFANIRGVKAELMKGDKLKPISLEGDELTVMIEKLGIEGELSVSLTNFAKLAEPATIARLGGKKANTKAKAPVVVSAEDSKEVMPQNERGSAVTSAEDNEPEAIAKVDVEMGDDGSGDSESGGETVASSSSGLFGDPFGSAGNGGANDDPFSLQGNSDSVKNVDNPVSVLKIKQLVQNEYSSLNSLKEAKVTKISVGKNETVGSKAYQIGTVSFQKDTLLGVRKFGAKALISDGKIEKWVWSISNQDME